MPTTKMQLCGLVHLGHILVVALGCLLLDNRPTGNLAEFEISGDTLLVVSRSSL